MDNPYTPPKSDTVVPTRVGPPLWQMIVSVPIALYCSVQYLAVSVAIISGWDTLKVGIEHPYLLALSKIWQPALLFASGILLLFRKKLALLGFTLYLISAALTFPIVEQTDVRVGFITVLGIASFAAFLYKTGRLR